MRIRSSVLVVALAVAACGGERELRRPDANVLLVTLDTTRADRIGAWGHATARTPTLDGLAREGLRFSRAYSSVPLTLPAHAALMTGTPPPVHGVRDNGGFFLADGHETLAEILRASGRATAAFVGAFVLNHHWGIAQGFDHYDDAFGPDDPVAAADLHQQRDGAEVADRAIAWLEANRARPFFAWLHFYDPHWPYEPKGELATAFASAPYDGEIAYADAQLGRVLDRLRELGLYENTVIVVTADHGEGLGEHGEPDHGIYAYDSTLHVPLVVRLPGASRRGVVDDVARDLDVMPTILDVLAIQPPAAVRGASLLRPAERTAYAESFYVRFHYGWREVTALREGRFKLVDLPTVELYDLERDPGETRNVADVHPERVAEMRATLRGMASASTPAPQAIDPEALARLQALGYVGGVAKTAGSELPDPKDKGEELDLLVRAARATSQAMRSGRYGDAAAVVERALEVEPNYVDGWQFLGTIYTRLGRPDDAVRALRRVLEANPDAVQARMGLARAHAAKGEHAVAVDLADSVLAANPRYVAAYHAAVESLVAVGRFDAAIERLRRLERERPDATGTAYEIARVLLAAGRLPEAEAQIRRALAVQPRQRSAHFNLALLADARGDREGARREYEAELASFPDNVEALTNLGILHMQAGRGLEGIRTFERLVATSPDDPRAQALLARARRSAGVSGSPRGSRVRSRPPGRPGRGEGRSRSPGPPRRSLPGRAARARAGDGAGRNRGPR
ncbi:MAG TPA: sulfatase-like hydrolase/transferase [Candidatus Polarisedimenticolaceae bacterium]